MNNPQLNNHYHLIKYSVLTYTKTMWCQDVNIRGKSYHICFCWGAPSAAKATVVCVLLCTFQSLIQPKVLKNWTTSSFILCSLDIKQFWTYSIQTQNFISKVAICLAARTLIQCQQHGMTSANFIHKCY